MLKKYCFECHDSESKEAGVNLQDIPFDLGIDIQTAERWQKILGVINSGEMPPEDSEPISDGEKSKFLEDLSEQLVIAREILSDSGGLITLRRLNRREYKNTIEDLLGVVPDVSSLPDDSLIGGFDTAGASLFFSSDQLEQYLSVARQSLRWVLVDIETAPTKTVRREPEIEVNRDFNRSAGRHLDAYQRTLAWKDDEENPVTDFGFKNMKQLKVARTRYLRCYPFLSRYLERPETKTGVALISTNSGAIAIEAPKLKNPTGGTYLLRVRLGAYQNAPERLRYLEFGTKVDGAEEGELKLLGHRKVSGTLDRPETIEIPIELFPNAKASYLVRQRNYNDRSSQNVLWNVGKAENGVGPEPAIWVDWIEWTGPLSHSWPPAKAKEILFPRPSNASEVEYVREVIRRFAIRAFRVKEPSSTFIDKLLNRYQVQRRVGMSAREAVVDALAIVLCSPTFLYIIEPTGGKKSRLSDSELAVRLSYFLWNAPPDDELRTLAQNGGLSDPSVLAAQTDRLLSSRRAIHFISSFTHQWLDMKRLDMFRFEPALHPEFDETTRSSAREEVYQTVRTLIDERRSLGELLKTDFVVVNDVLAGYYGLDPVQGSAFRKVSVPPDSPRGGLLGTIAIHAMGSDGVRSSPVERGAWVLRHLLNDPPPPAPANVPQLNRLSEQFLPARKLQKAHMEEPQCAQCHRKIDPIGYGLENFDAGGKWRERELVSKVRRGAEIDQKSFSINTTGALPDGEAFKDFFEMRDAIAGREDEFARGFAEALIAYGLGRPFGFSDNALAEKITRHAKTHDNRIDAFIQALVRSDPFHTK